jgi:RNA polymerase sigma-70 factor (ECF subfamily)
MSLEKKQSNLGKKTKNIHQDLIDACRLNDQKAQLKIYKLYYKAMYNVSLRIVNNEMQAEDVMQEAFLQAFQRIDQYDESATFGAWLKRIVINRSLDLLKKNKGHIPFDEAVHDIVDHNEEDHMEVLSYKLDSIHKGIEALPDAYRIVLSLYLLEGYDHEEISKILDISYNATRTKYSRAKQKLIGMLKQSPINIAHLN